MKTKEKDQTKNKNNSNESSEILSQASSNDKSSINNDNNSESDKANSKRLKKAEEIHKKTNKNAEQISQMESRSKPYKRERFVKNEYKNRSSLLDDILEDSYVNNSAFLGFVNLGKLVAIMFIITTPIVNFSIFSKLSMVKKT